MWKAVFMMKNYWRPRGIREKLMIKAAIRLGISHTDETKRKISDALKSRARLGIRANGRKSVGRKRVEMTDEQKRKNVAHGIEYYAEKKY